MKFLITQKQLEHRLLQLHLYSRLNTWLQWIGQKQPDDETRNIKLLELSAPYIRDLTVRICLLLWRGIRDIDGHLSNLMQTVLWCNKLDIDWGALYSSQPIWAVE